MSYRYVWNEDVLQRTRQRDLQEHINSSRSMIAGHVLQLQTTRSVRKSMEWVPSGVKRRRGRPKKTWQKV